MHTRYTRFNLIPLQFDAKDRLTSFESYRTSPHVFLVFNDNAHQSTVDLRSPSSHMAGSGNSIARPYTNAYGIPTGMNGVGFTGEAMNQFDLIDSRIDILKYVLWHRYIMSMPTGTMSGSYKCGVAEVNVMYSVGPDGYTLGSGTFVVAHSVLAYITRRLHEMIHELNDAIVEWSKVDKA